jgi:hypothetical protein
MFDRIRRWIRFNLLYLGCPPWDTGVSPQELNAFLSEKEPGRALDAGCGTGSNLLTMLKMDGRSSVWTLPGFQFYVPGGNWVKQAYLGVSSMVMILQGKLISKILLILSWISAAISLYPPSEGRLTTQPSKGG